MFSLDEVPTRYEWRLRGKGRMSRVTMRNMGGNAVKGRENGETGDNKTNLGHQGG